MFKVKTTVRGHKSKRVCDYLKLAEAIFVGLHKKINHN